MMKDALDVPCPVCNARFAEWCVDGNDWANIHLDRAYGAGYTAALQEQTR